MSTVTNPDVSRQATGPDAGPAAPPPAQPIPAQVAHDPAAALALARSVTPAGGLIIVTGSIYLVGAVRQAVEAE